MNYRGRDDDLQCRIPNKMNFRSTGGVTMKYNVVFRYTIGIFNLNGHVNQVDMSSITFRRKGH